MFVREAGALAVGLYPVGDLRGVAVLVTAPRVAKQRGLVDFEDLALDDTTPARNRLSDKSETRADAGTKSSGLPPRPVAVQRGTISGSVTAPQTFVGRCG